jgi:hypothetical protein
MSRPWPSPLLTETRPKNQIALIFLKGRRIVDRIVYYMPDRPSRPFIYLIGNRHHKEDP